MSFEMFLSWLQAPGINVVIGFIESFAIEWIPNWGNLDAKLKRLYTFLICLAIPLFGVLLGIVTGHYSANFEQVIWPALVAGMSAFAGSSAAHTRKLITRKDSDNA